MYIRDVMTRDVKTCRPDTDGETAALLMWSEDCGAVPVVDDDGKALGMITDRDICMATALQHTRAADLHVKDFMSEELFCCQPDQDIKNALKTMADRKIRRLAITNGEGKVEGILSIDDIVALAERGARGITTPELSFDDAIATFKAVCRHHH
ncbi:MAG: CBS domain-containing protein [Pseudomonadota bacterium]